MIVSNNRFGLFAKPETIHQTINQFVARHRQQLLAHADILTRAKLLRSYHQVKPLTSENYLRQFIKDFQKDPAFAETVALYHEKLNTYQNAKTQIAAASLKPKHSNEITHKLTPQQLAWQELMETLKRCTNNQITRPTLGWHPRHQENYYLAKLHIQWQQHEMQYGQIESATLPEKLSEEIAQERQQTVIANHLKAQQDLLQRKMEYDPTHFTHQQEKLQHQKELELAEILTLEPEFISAMQDIIEFSNKPHDSDEVQEVFDNALSEIQRQQRSIANNPALFNLTASSRHKNHALATLDKTDSPDELDAYASLISTEQNSTTLTL